MKKNTAKKTEVSLDSNSKKEQAIQRHLKLVEGKLSQLDQLSSELSVLVADTRKTLAGPQKAKQKAKQKPKPTVAGRPGKTKTRVTVNELQALREERSKKLKAVPEIEKKEAPVKASAKAKARQKPFTVDRPAPAVKKKKQA